MRATLTALILLAHTVWAAAKVPGPKWSVEAVFENKLEGIWTAGSSFYFKKGMPPAELIHSGSKNCDPAKKICPSGPTKPACTNGKCPLKDVLLILGGEYDADQSEVVSLGNEDVACATQVPRLPTDANWRVFFKLEGDPVLCDPSYTNRCYKFSPSSNTWINFKNFSQSLMGPTSVELENYILVTGENSGYHWNVKKEQFETGPALPYSAEYHCIATINATHALLMGGWSPDDYNSSKVYMFNRLSEQWLEMESMKLGRSGHACGLIGQSKVLVAGGGTDYENILSSVEVFDLKTETWSQGKDLPQTLTDGTSVQLEDTFLIVGGGRTTYADLSDTIYEYDAEKNDWLLWEQKLQVPRGGKAPVYRLPAQYLDCTRS